MRCGVAVFVPFVIGILVGVTIGLSFQLHSADDANGDHGGSATARSMLSRAAQHAAASSHSSTSAKGGRPKKGKHKLKKKKGASRTPHIVAVVGDEDDGGEDRNAASAAAALAAAVANNNHAGGAAALAPPATPAASALRPAAAAPFAVHDRVEVQDEDGEWEEARVVAVGVDGVDGSVTVDVKYSDDGEVEKELDASLVRRKQVAPVPVIAAAAPAVATAPPVAASPPAALPAAKAAPTLLRAAAAAPPAPPTAAAPPTAPPTAAPPTAPSTAVAPAGQLAPTSPQFGACLAAPPPRPAFVMPGVEKGGTTALFNFLLRHPQVLAKRGFGTAGPDSEVLFLGEHWDRGGPGESLQSRARRYNDMFDRPPNNAQGGCSSSTCTGGRGANGNCRYTECSMCMECVCCVQVLC